jgi:hypothetical protein
MKTAEFISPTNAPFFREAMNGQYVILWPDKSIYDGYQNALKDGGKQEWRESSVGTNPAAKRESGIYRFVLSGNRA